MVKTGAPCILKNKINLQLFPNFHAIRWGNFTQISSLGAWKPWGFLFAWIIVLPQGL